MTTADRIVSALRPHAPGEHFAPGEVPIINQLAAMWDARLAPTATPGYAPFTITAPIAAELVGHEAIVLEWYKDSVGVGTWGIGVTNKSGHNVDRYKDKPQTVTRCLEIYLWLLRERYAPDVVEAFAGHALTEAQFAAALSFHYNTGAIERASWVKLWKKGEVEPAKTSFMEWRNPTEIIERRTKERDLFFGGRWSNDGHTTIWPVKKPSYRPDWRNGKRVNILPELQALMGAAS